MTAASGRPPPIDLPETSRSGRDAVVVLDRPHLPRAPDARLHLVVDVEDPVLAAQLREAQQVVGRHRQEAALTLDGLEHDAGDGGRVDLRLEELLQPGDRVVGRDPAVAVRHGRAVDLGRERPEAGLVRLHLGGHRHRQQRASVEGVVEDDDGGPPGRRAGDLDGVLDRLGARVDEDRLLLLAGAGRQLGEAAADVDVRLVDPDHEALVEVLVGLRLDRVDDGREPVAGVLAADAAGEVDERAAVDVGDAGTVGVRDDELRGGDAGAHVAGALGEDAVVRGGLGRGSHRVSMPQFARRCPGPALALRRPERGLLPSQIVPMDQAISEVILLIGLAVGADDSLFDIRRERDERRAGRSESAALEAAAATSGRAVLISGITVMIAMAGTFFSGDKTSSRSARS